MDELKNMGLSTKTIVDWKMFCRDVAASYFLKHPEKIGLTILSFF